MATGSDTVLRIRDDLGDVQTRSGVLKVKPTDRFFALWSNLRNLVLQRNGRVEIAAPTVASMTLRNVFYELPVADGANPAGLYYVNTAGVANVMVTF